MSKQLNLNLGITADASQARAQIQELQTSLNNLISGSVTAKKLPITKDLIEAQNAAGALKVALDSAINTQTGKLDLSRFSDSIGKAGLKLSTIQTHLQALGPAGVRTFQSLASSIMQAEVPLMRSNGLVTQLWTTLKNTARWQLSSMVLHSFVSTLQGAVRYAQDLNQSLNNIRIVTGQSVEQMAKFAEQASRSAKALSATTTEYTNAALIFYQQGLSDAEVQKRTDVTIKMANVTRQSAEEVSDQMTAVWNNFYDGSQSLESFADKMVALGAATASSSKEIAGGLEKFAAIGDTIGLSFDYAAAALATITSNTRQTEEVVGTALKTIFARIQGLKLGETLEDGVELNKYSEALQSVGISIFEQNGELKAMDNILDEMGAKWDTLSKAQQTALAQTVAGVRQYNQLISLMDNWNSGDRDSFQANLDTVHDADGALQEQQDTYAESWEAARDRVKTAAQDIYDSILNDEFFIDLTDGFADLLDVIGTFVDSLGGLPGVLGLIGTLMTKVFSEQMAASVERMAYGIKSLVGINQKNAENLKADAYSRASKMNYDDGTEEGAMMNLTNKSQLDLQQQMQTVSKNMTEEERKRYGVLLDINRAYGEQATLAAQAVDAARQGLQDKNRDLKRKASRANVDMDQYNTGREQVRTDVKDALNNDKQIKQLNAALQNTGPLDNFRNKLIEFNKVLDHGMKPNAQIRGIRELTKSFLDGTSGCKKGTQEYANAVEQFKQKLNNLINSGDLLDDTMIDIANGFMNSVPGMEAFDAEIDDIVFSEMDLIQRNDALADSENRLKQHTEAVKAAFAGFKAAAAGFGTTVISAFNGISQITMGISSIKGMVDTLNNTEMSFGEKFLSVAMSMSMAIPALINGFSTLFAVNEKLGMSVIKSIGIQTKDIAVKGLVAIATAVLGKEKLVEKGIIDAETGAIVANTVAWYANPITWIVVAIVAVIAAIAALTICFIKLTDSLNADAVAAEKAKQTAEELSTAYDECANSYQDMIDTMSEYEEARNSLDQLVEGTDEYKEALQEANRAALELIQNNPGKFEAGKDYNWVGDQLVLSEDAMEQAKSDGKKQLSTMYGAKQVGAAKADQAQAKSDSTDLAHDMFNDVGNSWLASRDQYENIVDDARNLYAENQGLFANKNYMAEQLNLDANNAVDQELIEALWRNKDSMIELGDATKAAAESYKLATENAVRELLSENEDVQDSENKEEIIDKSQDNFKQNYENEMQKLKDEGWGTKDISKATGVNEQVKDVWAEYAKAAGLENANLLDTTGSDTNRKFVYEVDGEEKQVSLETMREVMATSKANETTDVSATKLAESIEKLNDVINENKAEGEKNKEVGDAIDAIEAVKNFALNDDFKKASREDLADVKNQRSTAVKKLQDQGIKIDEKDEKASTEAYLDMLFGDGKDGQLSDKTAKNFGYETADEMVEAFNSKLKEAEVDWQGFLEKNMPKNLVVPADVSLEAANNMSNQYEEINQGGYEGQLDRMFGDGLDGQISDGTAKKLGFNTAEEMVQGYEEAIASGDITNFVDKIMSTEEGAAFAKEKGFATGEELAAGIMEGAANVYNSGQFTENINAILSTIDPSQQAAAFEALANIDWSSWNATEQAAEALGILGINSEETTGKLKELEGSMREVAGASKDLGKVNKALDPDIDVEEYEALAKHLKSVADETDGLSKELKYNDEAAKKVSKAILRFDDAIQDVNDHYDDWKHTLKSGSLQDQAKLANELGDAYADMLDIDMSSLSNDFILNAENLELMKQAANGSEEAYRQLQEAAGKDILAQCGIDTSQYEADLAKIQGMAATANGAKLADVEAGASLDNAGFLNSLTEMVNAAGMTAQQATDYLASMGIDAEVETVEKKEPVERTVNSLLPTISYDKTADIPVVAGDGEVSTETARVPTISYKADPQKITDTNAGGGATLKVTSAKKSSGGNFKYKHSSNGGGVNGPSNKKTGGNNGGGNGGGGNSGGSSKPAKKRRLTKKSDTVERYKQTNDQLKMSQNILEDISREMENAWGPKKIKLMQKYQQQLNTEINLQKKLREEIKSTVWEDQAAIKNFMAEAADGDIGGLGALGLQFTFDDNTLAITNYDEIMSALHAKLNEYETQYNAFSTEEEQKTFEESTLAPFKEKIEYVQELVSTYDETVTSFIEKDNEIEDLIIDAMQQKFEELEYTLEIRVKIHEQDLEDLEHMLERLSDSNFFDSPERLEVISRMAIRYRQIANENIKNMREAERLYQLTLDGKEGGITDTKYEETIQTAKENIMEAESSIRDGIEEIGDELENTFDLVDERLDEQFNQFDQLIETMEHYKNVISLSKGEAQYEEFNKILKASQEAMRQRIEVDKAEVDIWAQQRAALEAERDRLPTDSAARLQIEENLKAVMEKEAEAKSQLMSDIEQLGEYAQEIFENAIEQAKIDFEEEMFGGSLSSVIEGIDLRNAKQEELLTTTNKIYETNKLIRNVEKDIEATTNNRAKQIYAEFQNKVKQKQEQNQLTQFELDLLTAEYEITKAQIALEEAQKAKDSVRLTRDAEGNYGYVYTANEDKVNDAEQALEDATNNYYNTALDGAQKYQDQIYQHIEEWEEKVTEIMLDQTLSEEEKMKKIEEIDGYYNTLIAQDKQLYYIAVKAMQEESYNNQVDYDLKGIKSAEQWFTTSKSFVKDLSQAQKDYDADTEEVATHTENNFGTMEEAIGNVTTKSQFLRDEIDKLKPKIEVELKDSIDKATEAWWKYIEALLEVSQVTDNMMKKQHDTMLKDLYQDDYAAQIQTLLNDEASYSDYDIQRLLEFRWEKLGGKDDTNYQALIEAGGTESELRLWEVLRKWKIEQTDWTQYKQDNPNATWADEVRAEKLDQDYAQLIIDYLASGYGRWNDSQVQKYLKEREIKINEMPEKDRKGIMTNDELKEFIAQKMRKKPEYLNTGGYTGEWGPEGRLAVLHEKELVLNAQDTQNFLSATNILREISQMLDRDALIASLGAINLKSMTLNSPADQVLQQEVTIHADFPNVTDHNEIEIAIDNLINAASQHAYKV